MFNTHCFNKLCKHSIGCLLLTLLLAGCNDDDDDNITLTEPQSVNIQFAAQVNDEPFSCGTTYKQVGNAATDSYRVNDFRLYIYATALVKSNGEKIPVALTQDGIWQNDTITFLDFENGCANGTTDINTQVVGTVPAGEALSDFNGICFKMGLPFEENHSDPAAAASPINASGMLWSWTTGRKFIRIDGVGDPEGLNQPFHVHLGSTGCVDIDDNGSEPDSACQYTNVAETCLTDFDMNQNTVVADIGKVLATSNIAVNTADTAPGCMSGNSDPECINVMPRLGLDFTYDDGVNSPTAYTKQPALFTVGDD